MHCPSLNVLPPPPPGRTGWPWTQACTALASTMPDGSAWPRLSIVTPSFNQARFLETTLRSILLQGYPNLEYFVLDGGSTDGSVEIIKKYEPWLTHWVTEPDGGQSAAINRGFNLGTGLFATWNNSDDLLCRDALANHATRFGFDPSVVYVGDCTYIDQNDSVDHVHRARVHSFEDLVRIRTVWRARGNRGNIDQPAVLFPRELALKVGGLNIRNHWTMDYELWGKFFLAGARFEYTHIPFGMFRVHDQQKTAHGWATTQSLIATAVNLVAQARDIPESLRDEVVADLYAHERDYWRETGRLARLGLPERVVCALRDMHASLRRSARHLFPAHNQG
jgi:glycosyltransferase involved in cell wall biosynthesis